MSTTLAYILGIVILIIGIGVSVALHELGHMIPAKRFGVKVPEYFIGFGPRIWSVRRGETEYGVKAIWLGGYVKLVGMLPPTKPGKPDRRRKDGSLGMVGEARAEALEEIGPGEEHRAFYSLSVPKKLIVMAGGILTNLVLGILLLAIAIGAVGIPGRTTTLSKVEPCVSSNVDENVPCQDSDPAGPASAAGIKAGDRVVSWGGVEVSTWEELQARIAAVGTNPTQVVIERDGAARTVSVTAVEAQRTIRDSQGAPVKDATGAVRTEARPYVGIAPSLGTIPQSPAKIPGFIGQAVGGTVKAIVTLPVGLYHAVQAGLGMEQRSADSGVVGLVGMGRMAGQATSGGATGGGQVPLSMRASSMLVLLGSLNLALFAFNLVPLLPLDGGHVAGACWEGIRRMIAKAQGKPDPGPVDTAKMIPVGQVGFGLLIVMALVLVWVDIAAPL
ncbi:M50 family metallopeptidase [Actinomyces naeslundii]|uniref:M50 family metallopeptidase n=1 Tax=Actinomyces naeslundii TaxID=1655 RepID=UPI00096D194B|nr:site-2 protease family protein [Actinomyces naeslundii]OMG09240.1 zinc metalloprotease [Actinomyces naeslundii]OMG10572.1 zinc metalloprotease [Actinomyces naeslundii]OMG18406.1 zinc metalloprotease [Actinomyces naeslundii]OMG19177.1 zinc metalloprotease [Actinomyces naeslundii]PKY95204.1 PDZ domain-containing protein [Actinomyces naeslundii]